MTRTRVRMATLGLAVAAVATSVTLTSGRSVESVEASDLGPRLCELSLIARDDPAAAGSMFMTHVHGPLHDVAATLAENDRPAAGRLLEAKNAVEQAVDSGQPAGLERSLRTLVERLPDVSSCEDV